MRLLIRIPLGRLPFRSTSSAADRSALFAGFTAPTAESSDFPCSCIIGFGSSPFPMRARAQHCRWSNVGPPNFQCIPFARDVLLDPGRMAVPRISALLMLRSTISTASAPATCLFRGSITSPTQLLCTLRGRRYRRLTQHWPATALPWDRSCTGWTAPAFVGAFGAEHDCLVGWIEVEPDDVDYFLSEFWIVR